MNEVLKICEKIISADLKANKKTTRNKKNLEIVSYKFL